MYFSFDVLILKKEKMGKWIIVKIDCCNDLILYTRIATTICEHGIRFDIENWLHDVILQMEIKWVR